MPLDEFAHLEPWFAHFDAERLGLGTTGNSATIVVTQDYDRLVFQRRVKELFATGVEVVARWGFPAILAGWR